MLKSKQIVTKSVNAFLAVHVTKCVQLNTKQITKEIGEITIEDTTNMQTQNGCGILPKRNRSKIEVKKSKIEVK